MKVCFETFGCRLNKAEALQMEAEYLAKGWKTTSRHSDADLIVIRGCSVTARAQYDCEKLISHLKRRHPTVQLKICGCIRSDASASKFKGLKASLRSTPRVPEPSGSQAIPTRTARAYLKVQDGCAGKCTFCIVPSFRGESKSEDFTELLGRTRRFIEAGYHEIVITGCNLSLYASQGKRLPDLLVALADLDAGCRIRLGSLEPGSCAIETIRAMAEHPNVCRFLHLPVQSGANKVLLAMRRPYAAKDVDEAANLATGLMPGIGLGCDLMTGFPGETDLDFAATKGLLKRLPFSNAHIFPFSERSGTLAAGFSLSVPKEIRSQRARALAADIASKRDKFARSFVGKTVEIVVEDEKTGRGWTGEYLPCEPVCGTFVRKSLIRIAVTANKGELLRGRPL